MRLCIKILALAHPFVRTELRYSIFACACLHVFRNTIFA